MKHDYKPINFQSELIVLFNLVTVSELKLHLSKSKTT